MEHLKRSNIGCEDQHIVPRLQLYMMWVAEKHVALGFNHATKILVGFYVSIYSSFLANVVAGLSGAETI